MVKLTKSVDIYAILGRHLHLLGHIVHAHLFIATHVATLSALGALSLVLASCGKAKTNEPATLSEMPQTVESQDHPPGIPCVGDARSIFDRISFTCPGYTFPAAFIWKAGESGLIASLRRMTGDESIQWKNQEAALISMPAVQAGKCSVATERLTNADIRIDFSHDGRPLLSFTGHEYTDFVVADNSLYLAKFSSCGTGCTVVAYDLASGAQSWHTKLLACLWVIHSLYSNRVRLSIRGDLLEVMGHEDGGDYIECLVRGNGRTVAHKLYRHYAPSEIEEEFKRRRDQK